MAYTQDAHLDLNDKRIARPKAKNDRETAGLDLVNSSRRPGTWSGDTALASPGTSV